MFSLHPQASRDFSKLFSQALGQVLLPPAPCPLFLLVDPSFHSVHKLCAGTGSHMDMRVCPHGNTVLWASSRKPSTHRSLCSLGICTFPA